MGSGGWQGPQNHSCFSVSGKNIGNERSRLIIYYVLALFFLVKDKD